jgi:diaminohydroxyphosphoribosylaminopyrimidine deaminase / 5-amino-6-(5-phosphoribosylamino)uracil reductase
LNGLSFPPSRARELMLRAVELAERGRGATAPNPCVGALLASPEGEILAEGWHKGYGQHHAEVEAIADARARGINPSCGVLFVTLEPCNHFGKTPPCTQAILAAGIRQLVVGTPDPDNTVTGGGIDHLRAGGVIVETGVAEQECLDLIADFTLFKTTDRPYVYLKLACTLDGRIATRTGDSRWVSGALSREEVHRLRGRVQAVMVGGRTFRADNPRLTCRMEGTAGKGQPLAVVVTSRLPLPEKNSCRLLRDRASETIFFVPENALNEACADDLELAGCRIWPMPELAPGRIDLRPGLVRLRRELRCFYVLCEGGGGLASTFAEQGFVDELWIFQAPKVLGDGHAPSLFSGRDVDSMDKCLHWRRTAVRPSGEDLWLTFRPQKP